MRLSEKPTTIEESLILAHLQAIGIAHRAIVALLGDRHAFQEDELLPEPKMVIYLKTITEEAAKIEEIVSWRAPCAGASSANATRSSAE